MYMLISLDLYYTCYTSFMLTLFCHSHREMNIFTIMHMKKRKLIALIY